MSHKTPVRFIMGVAVASAKLDGGASGSKRPLRSDRFVIALWQSHYANNCGSTASLSAKRFTGAPTCGKVPCRQLAGSRGLRQMKVFRLRGSGGHFAFQLRLDVVLRREPVHALGNLHIHSLFFLATVEEK